jgi:hypothetical protein
MMAAISPTTGTGISEPTFRAESAEERAHSLLTQLNLRVCICASNAA